MLKITLSDGSVRTYNNIITPEFLANDISQNLGKVALAAKVNGELWDLKREIIQRQYWGNTKALTDGTFV